MQADAAVVLLFGMLAIAVHSADADPQASPANRAPGLDRSPIRLSTAQRQTIGVTTGTAERRLIDKTIRAVARLAYDERKRTRVTVKFAGYVEKLFADHTGKAVRRGEPLFTIYSPDLLVAEREYLLSLANLERLRTSPVPAARDAAEALLRASHDRLTLWDLSDDQVRSLRESEQPKLRQEILSPVSGVVVEKSVVEGMRVEPGTPLYEIVDLTTLWAYADLYESDASAVRIGQAVRLSLVGLPDARPIEGRVSFVDPTVDPETRTTRVRFDVENSTEPTLRPGMYGSAEIAVSLGERLVVPRSAVLDSGSRQIVFVDAGDGKLVPTDVTLGVRSADVVEVTSGLEPGMRIVTSGNFLVDSESKLQSAESMMGMMGAIGMADWKMESAKPMDMGAATPDDPSHSSTDDSPAAAAVEPREKQAGDFTVALYPSEHPVGATTKLRLRVRDMAGRPVTGAKLRVRYTMDMPGMSIEQAEATPVGDGAYEASVEFTMGGPWGVVVEIDSPGRPTSRVKFTVRAG